MAELGFEPGTSELGAHILFIATGLLNLSTVHVLGWILFAGRGMAVLCIVGC